MTALAGEGRKMAGYDRDFLRLLTDKLNIVEVASSYLHLEKKGGTYWACCPFHHEKTASFHVDENRQFYHCFGCGASGNVIKLVQELENVDFGDAVKLLAERANLPLPQSGFDGERTAELKRKRDTLLKIMNDSAHFYLDNLNSGKADAHIEYILKRGIPANIVRSFGLGASLNSQDLPKFLLAKGYSRQDIVDSGAVNEVEGRLSDSQSGRLIFPIINAFDEVIAFGGRAIRPTDFAKYKNTKETLIFNKSKTLYNINKLKKAAPRGRAERRHNGRGLHGRALSLSGGVPQRGGKHGHFAHSGAGAHDKALLHHRAHKLRRRRRRSEGQHARAGDTQKRGRGGARGAPSRRARPDEVIKQRGPEAYRACLDAAMPLVDYKLEVSRRAHDLTKPEEKLKYVGEALKVVRTAETAAEREMMLKNLRDETGISFEALSRDLQQIPAAPQEKGGDVPKKPADTADAVLKASRFVVAAYLFGARYTQDEDIDAVPFASDVHSLIAGYVKSKAMLGEKITLSEIFDFFDKDTPEYDELCRVLDLDDGENLESEVSRKCFFDCLRRLKAESIAQAIEEVKRQFNAADDAESRSRATALLQQLFEQKKKIMSGDIR